MSILFPKPCADCGSAPVNHWSERTEARILYYFLPVFKPLSKFVFWLGKLLSPINNKILYYLILFLARLKILQIKNKPDEKNNWRSRVLWEEAEKRGIIMKEIRPFGVYIDNYWSEFKGKRYFFEGLPRPNGQFYPALEWMDDKSEMSRRFLKQGFPVARGGVIKTFKQAKKVFVDLVKPVITKPNEGSRSRHTTIHIINEAELLVAFKKGKQLCPWVAIQEELVGSVYRATVINRKLVAVLRRDPACVVGNGISNVKQLITKENKNPLRQGPLFHIIPEDKTVTEELAYQNLTWESVPGKDKRIALGTKTSRGVGGGIANVTAQTHPDNIKLFNDVGAYLNDPIVGIDFIIADIKKSWCDTPRCGIIECNSLPFIDLHHFPLEGEPVNVASKVWDWVYPASAN
ncbi:MAG: hypothetical protein US42_C0022G0004 [Candidatus Magasanikbacteria bacterium GW2011_GWC2_37_14]|uniref:ATP-grasp domain-containing protein n=1 Tax=Candidatus Magasanikbacteria bacterium GW2011_GWC2_37_14 TaxID=1619046 RepID=A0A0G0JF85_9BACT|nr:MAG: hypothetical protein US42_C0022G0004 [Candidatus Magasanikbacteria bacterium GW2011_GWC2_37_14]